MPGKLKVGLPPIARTDARLFILGSLPGDASLAAGQYYAHPQNQFWRLLGSVIDEDLQAMSYQHRLECLAFYRIGLWDVIGSAHRPGSLDQGIRLANYNRVERLEHDFPNLEAIGFNGGTSASIGRKLFEADHSLVLIDLPSSSPANTRPFGQKAAAWSQLKPFCSAGPCADGQSGQQGQDD